MKTSHMLFCGLLLVAGVVLLSSGVGGPRVPAAASVRADDGRNDLDDDAAGPP